MWLMWTFAVVIPLGMMLALVTGEIRVGGGAAHGASRMLRLEEDPIGFFVMIGVLCVLEGALLAALLDIRSRDRDTPTKTRGRRPDRR